METSGNQIYYKGIGIANTRPPSLIKGGKPFPLKGLAHPCKGGGGLVPKIADFLENLKMICPQSNFLTFPLS